MLVGFAQAQSFSYKSKNGDPHLLGQIERHQLEEAPYQEWFNMVYDRYETDQETIDKINEFYKEDISIKIYLGTWCGDSKREVTRFMKIVDQSDIDMQNVEMIGLDNRSDNYKQGINREEKGLNIHRVPTFIFYKEGEEISRIVEYPVSSLEKDLAQIYAGIAPKPNYRVANYLGNLFEEKSLIEADTFITQNARYLKRMVKNEGELNTMGYVLLAADEVEKAIIAFKLNTLLFPESSNTYDSLGEAYKEAGHTNLAIQNYIKSSQLDPENKNAIQMIEELLGAIN